MSEDTSPKRQQGIASPWLRSHYPRGKLTIRNMSHHLSRRNPMKRILGLLTAVVLLAPATGRAAEVKAMDISIKSGEEDIKAYLAMPDGKGPFPGIVVIQEFWG